jgi:carbohydrate kinase (thermoresistant glucokinase family)
MKPPALILGGICLTGKTTLALALQSSGLPVADFVEGDSLHTPESIERMRFGTPLADADRVVWRERIGQAIANRPEHGYRILTCSALTRAFRDSLRQQGPVRILFLMFSRTNAEKRARRRLRDTWVQLHADPDYKPHYYQPTIYPALLDGQYRDLQPPGPDEADCLILDLDQFPSGEWGPELDFASVTPKLLEWLHG